LQHTMVLREYKKRKAAPGTTPSFTEQATWNNKLEFFLKPGASAKAKASAKAAAKTGVPMLPNYLSALALDNMLVSMKLGLSHFQLSFRLATLRAGVRFFKVLPENLPGHACSEGQTHRLCVMDGATGARRLAVFKRQNEFHLLSDMGPVGFRMSTWLFTLGDINGSFSSDMIAHDVYNSIGKAIKRAGLWMVVLEIAFLCNYTFGPFKSHGFFQSFVEGAKNCFAFVGKDSDMWKEWFYKPIAKDHGLFDPETFGTTEHSSMVYQTAKDDPMIYNSGDMVKLSRWGSIWDRYKEKLKEQWSTKLMVNVVNGLEHGWFACSEDLKLFAMRAGSVTTISSTTVGGGRLPMDRRVSQSSEVINKLKAKCTNTPHVATVILANTLTRKLFATMSVFVEVSRSWSGRALVSSKTTSATRDFRIRMARGEWRDEIIEILSVTSKETAMRDALFICSNEVEAALDWD
jgi:hypothetical protein